MPSRILREGINHSHRIDALTPLAELFYRRLMTVVDDYGRFHASPVTLRGACWPLHPERVTDKQIAGWIEELSAANEAAGEEPLLYVYQHRGVTYLEISGFGQQKRSKSKFPDRLSIDKQMQSSCEADAKQMRSLFVSECVVVDEVVIKPSAENPPAAPADQEQHGELEVAISECARTIHQNHPQLRRDCSARVVEKNLRAALKRHCPKKSLEEKKQFLAELRRSHEARCDSGDWQKDGGQYAKGLSNYMAPTMDRYLPAEPVNGIPIPGKRWEDYTPEERAELPSHMNPNLWSDD